MTPRYPLEALRGERDRAARRQARDLAGAIAVEAEAIAAAQRAAAAVQRAEAAWRAAETAARALD
ncbi:MAG: hypothetical protein K8W52_37580, partial [Deltaproteobacteria bacterium]|nr:hypothetical protein [Deltaproteobacteria bacterium]